MSTASEMTEDELRLHRRKLPDLMRSAGSIMMAKGLPSYARDCMLAAEEIENFWRLDREAATHVESVICMRTGFTGEPPYVGWRGLGLALSEALDERDLLKTLINTPEVNDFMAAVPLEAAHQIERWGSAHDAGKQPEDWFWLIGYLAGKALHSQKGGNIDKAKHHVITTAAALLNWHRAITGSDTRMRPGVR